MDSDAEHLRLLSLFFYIKGGITAVFSCFFILYIVMGGAFALMPASAFQNHNNNAAPPAFMGFFFMAFGGAFVLVGWTMAALSIYAGRCLAQRRHHIFCMVIAGINCIFIPYGTILGVFSLIVLQRPSVKLLFDRQ